MLLQCFLSDHDRGGADEPNNHIYYFPLIFNSRASSPGRYRFCLFRCSLTWVPTTTLLTLTQLTRLTSPHSLSLHLKRFLLWLADS